MKIAAALALFCALAASVFLGARFLSPGHTLEYSVRSPNIADMVDARSDESAKARLVQTEKLPPPVVSHIPTPEPLKAVYMTSWIAGTPSLRGRVTDLIEQTEVNAVVIDVKDDTGRITFAVDDPALVALGSAERRIRDIRELIAGLHAQGVYVIGRIAVFQDPYLAHARSELAVKTGDGSVWRDRKGLSWLDPGSREVWDYVAAIGRQAYAIGFDEINFDYIRFPSDGNLAGLRYPFSEGKEKTEVIRAFFTYLDEAFEGSGIPISADLFGQTTVDENDMGIGQLLEDALPYFDYIAPMVYPSHYAHGFNGYANPAEEPYEVVRYSLDRAVERAKKLEQYKTPTTTPPTISTADCKLCKKFRPWVQDFDLGADYTAEMVRAQIRATNEAGIQSWMLWDPGNYYTRGALLGR